MHVEPREGESFDQMLRRFKTSMESRASCANTSGSGTSRPTPNCSAKRPRPPRGAACAGQRCHAARVRSADGPRHPNPKRYSSTRQNRPDSSQLCSQRAGLIEDCAAGRCSVEIRTSARQSARGRGPIIITFSFKPRSFRARLWSQHAVHAYSSPGRSRSPALSFSPLCSVRSRIRGS